MFSLKAGSNNIALTPLVIGPAGGIININPTLTGLINVTIGGLNLFGASVAVTTPNTDLYLTPPSGASVSLRGNGYVIPLKFYNAARTFYVGFQTTTLSGNTLWTLPAADGTSNQALLTNGSGILSWGPPGGVGTVTSISAGSNIVLSPNPITTTGSVSLSNTPSGLTSIGVGSLSISGSTIDNPTDLAQIKITNSIVLAPDSTDPVFIGGGGSINPLAFNNAGGTNYVALQAGAVTGNTTWTLPLTDGASGEALITNGSGILSWSSTGVGSVTSISQGANISLSPNPITTTGTVALDTSLTSMVDIAVQTLNASGGNLVIGQNIFPGASNTITIYGTSLNIDYVCNIAQGAVTTGPTAILPTSLFWNTTLQGTLNINTASALNTAGPTNIGSTVCPTYLNYVTRFSNGTYYNQFEPSPSLAANVSWIWPLTDSTGTQFLQSDGSGNLSWGTGATGTVTSITQGTNMSFSVTPITTTGTINLASSISGLTSVSTAALTAAGTVNINTTGSAATTIGNAFSTTSVGGVTILSGTITGISGGGSIYFSNDIALEPAGANPVIIGNGSNINPLQFYNATGSHYVALQAGAVTGNTTWTLPLTDSTGAQFLQSNGSGTLSWASGNSGTVTSITQGTNMSFSTSPITTTGTINLASNVLGLSSLTSSSLTYSTGTAGTASASNTLVTGVGTAWTQAMVGGVIVFSNGVEGFIIEVNSSGQTLSISAAITVATGTSYVIYYGGTQHDTSGFLNTKNILVENIAEYRNPKTGFYVKQPIAVTINKAAQAKMTGGTWVSSNAFTSANLDSVCWAPQLGLFVAVGGFRVAISNNVVLTSPDGMNWTFQTAAATLEWISICWSPDLGLLCAINNNGTSANSIMTSPDSITWTSRSSPSSPLGLTSICWSSELQLFCASGTAVTSGAAFLTSPDGITWTGTGAVSPVAAYGLTWSPELGIFVGFLSAAAQAHQVATSPDGVNWKLSSSSAQETWQSCCWSPELGLFVAVASNNNPACIMTSPNGINWTTVTLGTAYELLGVCWSSQVGLFIAVSHNVTVILSSPDGVTWSTISVGGGSQTYHGICYSPELGIFCAVYDATIALISPNATLSTLGNTNIGGALNVTNTANINTTGITATTIGNTSSTTNIGGPLNLKGTINILNVSPLLFYDTAGTNYVGFKAASSLSGNTTWTLPTTDGSSGEALVTNGSGVLSWSSTGVGSVTSITQGTNMSFSVTPITTTGTINLASTVSGLTSLGTAALTVTGLSTLGAITQVGIVSINSTGSAQTNIGGASGFVYIGTGSGPTYVGTGSGQTYIGTGGSAAVNIGNTGGNTAVTGNLSVTGTIGTSTPTNSTWSATAGWYYGSGASNLTATLGPGASVVNPNNLTAFVTYAANSTTGDTWTFSKTGIYSIVVTAGSSSTATVWLDRNSPNTQSYASDTYAQMLVWGSHLGSIYEFSLSWIGVINSGDVVRFKQSNSTFATELGTFQLCFIIGQ